MLQENTIYCGDNLEVMQGFEDECVDLAYADPPFFSSRQYEIVFGNGAEKRMFHDRWVKMGETGRYSKDINVYLNFMEPRIKEIYRVLKKTGVFWLHCDWHADAYLRVSCDQIFGYNRLLGIIYWYHPDRSMSSRFFPDKTDTILCYSKSSEYTFNTDDPCLRVPIKDMKRYNKTDENGRKYAVILKNGKYSNVYFKDEGRLLTNVWEFPSLRGNSRESLGYPTQKPEALLKPIIVSTSNKDDIVLDPFAGGGTTVAVAKSLGRKFVAVEVSPTGCHVISDRIKYPLDAIIGLPLTVEEISSLTGFEFQNSVIRLLDPTLEAITVNNKGADGGIDGSYYDMLISVKKYKAGRKDLDEFVATMYRNKKQKGIFIALDFSADFVKEIARLEREQEVKIYHYTVGDIIEGKHRDIISDENISHGKLI